MLKFDTAKKMGVDQNSFPKGQHMVDMMPPKGKIKVLTSASAKKAATVDPEMQILAEEFEMIKKKREKEKSRYKQKSASKTVATKSRVTSQILLNKWQRQKEENYRRWLREEENARHQEEVESHWNCLFFRHCWNKGLKLPTVHNCPECSDQSRDYRRS